jgi:hypothetical protein
MKKEIDMKLVMLIKECALKMFGSVGRESIGITTDCDMTKDIKPILDYIEQEIAKEALAPAFSKEELQVVAFILQNQYPDDRMTATGERKQDLIVIDTILDKLSKLRTLINKENVIGTVQSIKTNDVKANINFKETK